MQTTKNEYDAARKAIDLCAVVLSDERCTECATTPQLIRIGYDMFGGHAFGRCLAVVCGTCRTVARVEISAPVDTELTNLNVRITSGEYIYDALAKIADYVNSPLVLGDMTRAEARP